MNTPTNLQQSTASERQVAQKLERQLARALAPFDKRALALAVATTCAVAIAVLTIASLYVDKEGRFPLNLLAQYFRGYSVTWAGVVVGALWAFATGFCGGWFLAFIRNVVIALWVMKMRIRADVASSRELLDHI